MPTPPFSPPSFVRLLWPRIACSAPCPRKESRGHATPPPRPPDRMLSPMSTQSSTCKNRPFEDRSMRRRMAIPDRGLLPRSLSGGRHAPFPLSALRRPSPRPNRHLDPASLPPGRLLTPLSRVGAVVQLDPGRRQPPVAGDRGRVAAALAFARDTAAGAVRHAAAVRRPAPTAPRPAAPLLAPLPAAAGPPAPPLPPGHRHPCHRLLQARRHAAFARPQGEAPPGYGLRSPLRQRLAATQRAVLHRGPDTVRPRRVHRRAGAPLAPSSHRQRLCAPLRAHGPRLLVGRCLPLPATGPLPVFDPGHAPR